MTIQAEGKVIDYNIALIKAEQIIRDIPLECDETFAIASVMADKSIESLERIEVITDFPVCLSPVSNAYKMIVINESVFILSSVHRHKMKFTLLKIKGHFINGKDIPLSDQGIVVNYFKLDELRVYIANVKSRAIMLIDDTDYALNILNIDFK